MIHVIATIEVKPGGREAFLDIFKRNVPAVRAEDGCLAYVPTVDLDSGIVAQGDPRPDVVTVVEAWESLAHLHAHLKAPHMLAYREQVKDLVRHTAIHVLAPV